MHGLADVALRHAAVLLQQRQDLAIESVEFHGPSSNLDRSKMASRRERRNSVA